MTISERNQILKNIKSIEQLRKGAESLRKTILKKENPAIASMNPTRRRDRIASSMYEEAKRLSYVREKMVRLIELHEEGIIDPLLSKIRYKTQIEAFKFSKYPEYHENDTEWWRELVIKEQFRLKRIGITKKNYSKAKLLLNSLIETKKEDPIQIKIKELENELIGSNIPGFFITPKGLAKKMVDYAKIGINDKILEPNAGNGSIAEVIRELYPNNVLNVCEKSRFLVQILELKRFTVKSNDFLSYNDIYDRILMNPPFEGFQDIDHIRHAYSLLKEEGILVSICGESAFFHSKDKAVKFREWLDEINAYVEKLPQDSFKGTLRGSGANARLIVFEKS